MPKEAMRNAQIFTKAGFGADDSQPYKRLRVVTASFSLQSRVLLVGETAHISVLKLRYGLFKVCFRM